MWKPRAMIAKKWQRQQNCTVHTLGTTVIPYRCHSDETNWIETVHSTSKSTMLFNRAQFILMIIEIKMKFGSIFRWCYTVVKSCTMKNKFTLPWFRPRSISIETSHSNPTDIQRDCFHKNRTWKRRLLICPLMITNTITRSSNQISLH